MIDRDELAGDDSQMDISFPVENPICPTCGYRYVDGQFGPGCAEWA